MGTKKFAFIQKGKVPLASEKVAQVLQGNFPDFEIDVIDVRDLLKNRKKIVLINLFVVLKEYGLAILLGQKRFKECFFRTTYIFRKIRRLLADRLSQQKYAFTFQMQSLYDASQAGTPHFVYTDHTNLANLYYDKFGKNKLYSAAWLELEKTIYQNATRVFTRSGNISQSLVEQYLRPAEQVVCVYAGSNAELNRAPVNDSRYKNKNILFVGIDWDRKGGPELAEAFKLVLQAHPDARLTVVGSSPRLDLPNCEVAGRVPLEEVSGYYQRASIFCLPTRLEPFGIAFVEALSYRLPIVATDVGAIPDFINHGYNGYMVRPYEVDPLAAALTDLLDSPERCRLFGERGYHLAMERYTWGKVGQRLRENILPFIKEPVRARMDKG